MCKNNNILEEYKSLRTEIAGYEKTISQLQVLLAIAPGALLGTALGVKESNAFLYFSPAFIIVPVILQITNSLKAILKIGAYISVFIEPNASGLNWETKVIEYRKCKKMNILGTTGYEILVAFGFMLTGFFFAYQEMKATSQFLIIASAVFLLVLLALVRKHLSYSHRQKYIDAWAKLKKKDN